MKFNTDAVIDNMVNAACGEGATARERHLYREALRNLVRLAKSEQITEMKASVDKLTSAITAREAKRRARAILQSHRLPAASGQEQLEFNRN